MQKIVEDSLVEIIKSIWDIEISHIDFETPPKKEMGDFAFPCFMLARELKKSPIQIAQQLAESIMESAESKKNISLAVAVGPYVNIFLSDDIVLHDFKKFLEEKSLYGENEKNKDKTIYIDYIGANVGKPLHIGHMCTPLHGQVFVNLYKKLGYNVISDSHIGDWGIIFGKLIVAYEKYGKEEELEDNAVEHLFQLYVKISTEAEEDTSLDQAFRDAFYKLSHGDSQMMELWARFTKYSISVMNILLSRIFVFPQYDIGESFYEGLGLPKMEDYPDLEYSMKDIVQELIGKGIATQNDDGSVGVVFPEEMKIPSCILQKRDGTHGYLASDLASVKYRVTQWNIKKIVYFVDVRQQLHFKQVESISRMASWLDNNIEFTHAYNGFISLKDGAMSTRKGKIIKLESLLDESEQRAEKIILEKRSDISSTELQELSKIIGIGAIKYGYLKKSRENDVIFDWDEFMTFEGNSGPYIQYAYVRAKKVVEKYGIKTNIENLNYTKNEEKELIKHILHFPKMIQNMSDEYQAHILCSYVYELTKRFSSFYNIVPILSEGVSQEEKNSRIVLLESFLNIVSESFSILAIPLPNEM